MKKIIKKLRIDCETKYSKTVTGPYVNGYLVDANGCSLIVESSDMVVGKTLRFKGNYGETELYKIQKLINKQSHVAFIGAHVGALAIPVAKMVQHAVIIEANPVTYKYLERNILINQIDNVTLHNVAVGEKEGEISFILNTHNSGGSKRTPVKKKQMYYYDRPATTIVPMVTFESLTDEKSKFDLIFMDVEGSEYFALKGMQKTLDQTENLVLEFIGHHICNVANVTIDAFLDQISNHFSYLFIPSKNQYVKKQDFKTILSKMIDNNENDDGIVFSKKRVLF